MAGIQAFDVQFPREILHLWVWFVAFGVGILLLGIIAIVRSMAATVASMLFFGWLLVLVCAIEIVGAVMVGHWAGFFQHLLAAILFGTVGFLMIARPTAAAEVLTLLMAVFFIVGGLFQLIGSATIGLPGWGWQAADGIITIGLGLLVLAKWPASGLWVIGLFVGIDLAFYGCALIALGLGLHAV
jgi:uncharacterized membrane protein HdeD (DUF308 family)